jgi:hypothetical protein
MTRITLVTVHTNYLECLKSYYCSLCRQIYGNVHLNRLALVTAQTNLLECIKRLALCAGYSTGMHEMTSTVHCADWLLDCIRSTVCRLIN